ncbi:MAG: DUF1566 domain-containing protein [Verrucomicrobia bacterium]|nr:DUF1566 domain-containing protein [Verrucomicrobiota bacterium]
MRSKCVRRAVLGIVVLAGMLLVGQTNGGELNSPSAPAPTMHTLEEIYQKVTNIAAAVTAPAAAPAPVAKTGQTTSYATGDDGDLEPGVASPSPRFTDNSDGTVTDNLTGLIWLKDADAGDGTETWADALTLCNGLANGQQGLTDGSSAGDWRLPTRFELESLLDLSKVSPALPSGHPFTAVQSSFYWSSTTYAGSTAIAWIVSLSDGDVGFGGKGNAYYVWPVRGGE